MLTIIVIGYNYAHIFLLEKGTYTFEASTWIKVVYAICCFFSYIIGPAELLKYVFLNIVCTAYNECSIAPIAIQDLHLHLLYGTVKHDMQGKALFSGRGTSGTA